MRFIKHVRILIFLIWTITLSAFLLFALDIFLGLKIPIYFYFIPVVTNAIIFLLLSSIFKKIMKGQISLEHLNKGIVIPKIKFEDKLVHANSEIFSQSIKSVHPSHDGIFRIKLELSSEPSEKDQLKFYVIKKCQTNQCEKEIDIKGQRHIIDVAIDPREIINFKFNKDISLRLFSVEELYIPN